MNKFLILLVISLLSTAAFAAEKIVCRPSFTITGAHPGENQYFSIENLHYGRENARITEGKLEFTFDANNANYEYRFNTYGRFFVLESPLFEGKVFINIILNYKQNLPKILYVSFQHDNSAIQDFAYNNEQGPGLSQDFVNYDFSSYIKNLESFKLACRLE